MSNKLFTRPIIFLAMGAPGTGKSWFSRQLSKQLKVVHIDSERIRYELFEEQSYSPEEEVVVENMVDYFAGSLINRQISMVIDGTSSSVRRRKEIAKYAEKSEYEIVLVWIQTNDELSKMRALTTSDTSVKNFKRKLSDSTYETLIDRLEKPTEKEEPVVISGSHSGRTQLKAVVSRLNSHKLIKIQGKTPSRPSTDSPISMKETPASDEEEKIRRRNTQRIVNS